MIYRRLQRGSFYFTSLIVGALLFALPTVAVSDEIRDVDVAIVLAVDMSFSIDREDALRQRDGHVRALLSKQVLDAIKAGPHGCAAISYIEWSGSGSVRHILPWTEICNAEQAAAAAAQISGKGFAGVSRLINRRTSLSYAIDVSGLLLDDLPVKANRKVIDISSDGTNNDGVPVETSRKRALDRGYVINGIVLAADDPGVTADLPGYFRDNVIGGPGAFVIAPRRPDDYRAAILKKLVQEIAGLAVTGRPVFE
jgi:hypothetical protein